MLHSHTFVFVVITIFFFLFSDANQLNVTWLYPQTDSVFNYLDTVNLSWTSNYPDPMMYFFCASSPLGKSKVLITVCVASYQRLVPQLYGPFVTLHKVGIHCFHSTKAKTTLIHAMSGSVFPMTSPMPVVTPWNLRILHHPQQAPVLWGAYDAPASSKASTSLPESSSSILNPSDSTGVYTYLQTSTLASTSPSSPTSPIPESRATSTSGSTSLNSPVSSTSASTTASLLPEQPLDPHGPPASEPKFKDWGCHWQCRWNYITGGVGLAFFTDAEA